MTSHDPFNPKARDLFDRASERLDQGTAFRLQRVRLAALQPRRLSPRAILIPTGAFAAAVLALGIAWWTPTPQVAPGPINGVSEIDVDALVDEDPELYAWLADAPVAVAATGPGR